MYESCPSAGFRFSQGVMHEKALFVLLIAVSAATLWAQDIALPPPAGKSGVDLLGAIINRRVSKTFIKKDISTAANPTASALSLYTVDTTLTPSFLKTNPALFLQMAHATAGFSAQNISLTASSLKLASIVQYTLKAADTSEALKLGKDEVPLFIQQLGYME